ncbi:phage regulatory CII family protein [Desulfovibrio sp. ZJ369]|uniref:phage regulatory CII family protein n=1 Tax=Desulfovibrio sp. ZJ369 TaxID=2709793 RepID=UPI0013EBDF4E|nr:phage regulatory CII family protein [Desulfovibrio sp. ZJ369]
MPDYQNMTATEAIRHAKDVSGLTAEEIGAAAGLSAAVVRRYLQRGDGYDPGLSKIPALCRAMHNTVLIQWQQAQLERQAEDVPPARTRAQVLTAVARAAASMGDVQRRLADSEGGGIDPACARDVRGLVGDVIEDCRVVMAMLAVQASHADITECMPLASLRPERKRPWWAIWRRRA